MIYFCCDDSRRQAVREHATLNGIDFLEVLDDPGLPDAERQRKLFVHFVNTNQLGTLNETHVRIEGGERIRAITVKEVSLGAGSEAHVLTVEVDQPGDFSIYTLRLVIDAQHPEPPDGFDPRLSAADFSFKAECPSDFDCRTKRICPPEPQTSPDIDYLAKDYASFRRLMLDRLSLLMPQWQERNPADAGIALVELLAYVGDCLSYQQDAVATEAYLGTARRRTSVRRHARLVDYFMHDGSNARVWVQVRVNADNVPVAKGTQLFTRAAGQPIRIPPPPDSRVYERALAAHPEVFETLHAAQLYQPHNDLFFYTWGARECCLPKGATRATLRGHFPNLTGGDVLIFEEILNPRTGQAADADPAHRHAVRLNGVRARDQHQEPLTDPLNGQPITEISWDAADALPFPLCVSLKTEAATGDQDASVARGNIVLADHGRTIGPEDLGQVPEPQLERVPAADADRCQHTPPEMIAARFRPALRERPLTYALPLPQPPPPAAGKSLRGDPAGALPGILRLESQLAGATLLWTPQRDLLNSDRNRPEFVVEVETDGTAYLRFGDGQHGLRPQPGTTFTAVYRVGNGPRGNVAAESLQHIVSSDARIEAVRNPLPAQGGTEPESIERVRQDAPHAFRRQERAVTPEDYAEVAERHAEVQRAAATFRWTGSWHTVFLTVDRLGGLPVDEDFQRQLRRHMERYRMAGYDLEVDGPRFVPLEIEVHVCVLSDYFRSSVKAALLEVFSSRSLPDGRRGEFHPDNFTFGQPVYLSRLIAAAQAVAGVESVRATKFQQQGRLSFDALQTGRLEIGRLEIARLDNDPNFPERGVFHLVLGGGK